MERVVETFHGVDLVAVDEVVRTTGLKFYDASYVWLARERGCLLFTRDQHMLRECKDVAREPGGLSGG